MPLVQDHISASTPMGANLVDGGATFRVWAPGALHVYLAFNGVAGQPDPSFELVKDPASGHWTGFAAGVQDGTKYRFFVVGLGGSGLKRDPWARELDQQGPPDCDCIVRSSSSYPWHDNGFVAPAFSDLVVYQFHVGRFYARDATGKDNRQNRVAKLLDALDRVSYWADLGVNAVQPLPLVEFPGEWSLGYNGTDLFSPEEDYCVAAPDLPAYLAKVNALLAQRGQVGLTLPQLSGHVNQVKAFIDVCHCFGIAVIPDVVYNHCGGTLDAQSLDYFDFPANPAADNSIYFSANGWAGGKVFAFQNTPVESYLISNAVMFLDEYHADGIRFDEVTVIDNMGGWFCAQHMTDTLRYRKPNAALIAEYWGQDRWLGTWSTPAGMGFDMGYSDGIRDAVRSILGAVATGSSAAVDLDPLQPALNRPWNVTHAWQAYNCLENQDFVLDSDGDHRKPRIPRLSDATNPRSWYARSRSRVATGILLTAPGVPMLFMGEEFLEDKLWSDDPNANDLLIWWDGLDGLDPAMGDFHRCTRDLIALRHRHPALRADPINVFHIDNANRVLAFHRWIPAAGRDVVVVASLNESAFSWGSYQLGLPLAGAWIEAFNSDFYDRFPNQAVQGNGGQVFANGPPRDNMPTSAGLTIPANGLLLLTRELGRLIPGFTTGSYEDEPPRRWSARWWSSAPRTSGVRQGPQPDRHRLEAAPSVATVDRQPFDLSLDLLRRRTSMKWREAPSDVLPLWVAEMDVMLADPVARALHDAIALGDTGYATGTDYAEAVRDFAMARWGWSGIDASRCALVPDVMMGIVEVLRLVTRTGSAVVVTPPVYPPFYSFVEHMDRRIVEAPLSPEGRIDLSTLEDAFAEAAGGGPVALLLANPHNPTGAVHTADELAQVAALADRFVVRVLADEVHAPLVLPGAQFTPYLSVPGTSDAFSVTSASKAWNLAGLKAAVVVAGETAAADLALMPEEVGHGPSHLGVIAHTAAFRNGGEWLDGLLGGLDDNRCLLDTLIREHLPTVSWIRPEGTYLAWLDCRSLGLGTTGGAAEARGNVHANVGPAAAFLERGRVLVSSGPAFGRGCEGFVRLNFATSPQILTEALRRMGTVAGTATSERRRLPPGG